MGEDKPTRPKIEVGYRVGHLTVIEKTEERRNKYMVWRCRCDCGKDILLDTRYLQRGTKRDCGCMTKLRPGQKDITGMRFGKLIAVEPLDTRRDGRTIWRCKCDCGGEIDAPLPQLTAGYRKSCGCLSHPPLEDLTGKKFNMLTVTGYAGKRKGRTHYWNCVCECGNTTTVRQDYLKSGKTKSCGCLAGKTLHEKLKLVDGTSVMVLESVRDMFSQSMYPYRTSLGTLNEIQPIQCYSGKETTLRKFLNMDTSDKEKQKVNRDTMVKQMKPIIKEIFKLWEVIECEFPTTANSTGRRYGTRKYSKFHSNDIVGYSIFEETPLQYIIPKGLMYPLIGSFRALVVVNEQTGMYEWRKSPIDVWKAIGSKLVAIVLDEKAETPDTLAKNSNLWSNLFKEIYIYAYMN